MSLVQKGRGITLVALVCLGAVYVRALAFTPVERLQGPAQKIFYLHVPAALWTEAAMILVGLAGTFYLFLKDPRLDRFAEASAEVGTVFATIVLTTGPIWGKPSAPSLPSSMLATWLFSLTAFTLLYVGFVTQRYALSLARDAQRGGSPEAGPV